MIFIKCSKTDINNEELAYFCDCKFIYYVEQRSNKKFRKDISKNVNHNYNIGAIGVKLLTQRRKSITLYEVLNYKHIILPMDFDTLSLELKNGINLNIISPIKLEIDDQIKYNEIYEVVKCNNKSISLFATNEEKQLLINSIFCNYNPLISLFIMDKLGNFDKLFYNLNGQTNADWMLNLIRQNIFQFIYNFLY